MFTKVTETLPHKKSDNFKFLEPFSKECDTYCNKHNRCINYAVPHKGLQ